MASAIGELGGASKGLESLESLGGEKGVSFAEALGSNASKNARNRGGNNQPPGVPGYHDVSMVGDDPMNELAKILAIMKASRHKQDNNNKTITATPLSKGLINQQWDGPGLSRGRQNAHVSRGRR